MKGQTFKRNCQIYDKAKVLHMKNTFNVTDTFYLHTQKNGIKTLRHGIKE